MNELWHIRTRDGDYEDADVWECYGNSKEQVTHELRAALTHQFRFTTNPKGCAEHLMERSTVRQITLNRVYRDEHLYGYPDVMNPHR